MKSKANLAVLAAVAMSMAAGVPSVPYTRSRGGRGRSNSMPSLDYGSGAVRKLRRAKVKNLMAANRREQTRGKNHASPKPARIKFTREQRISAEKARAFHDKSAVRLFWQNLNSVAQ
jgi:hypothetical protein